MKEKHEQHIHSPLKENQRNVEEMNPAKTSLTPSAKEVQKAKEEKDAFQSRIRHMEKEIPKLTEEKSSFKIRVAQMDVKDSVRKQDVTEQREKTGETEENAKYLTGKTTDLEKRFRRDNVQIWGLPENRDPKKSRDIIFHDMIQENCPDILEPEGKRSIRGIRRTPPERAPKGF